MQLSPSINERAQSILDWTEPQSLQRLCVLRVARSIVAYVDSAILGHIFKKEYEFDELVRLVRHKFDHIVGGHLPAEIAIKVLECTRFLSSTAGLLLGSLCASVLTGDLITESRCMSLPPAFINQCLGLWDSAACITLFDATGIEFSDEVLLALSSSKSADTLFELQTGRLCLSARSETYWLKFSVLDTIIMNHVGIITVGAFRSIAVLPAVTTLQLASAEFPREEIIRIILAPTATPKLKRFEFTCKTTYCSLNFNFEPLLSGRPHLERLERLPFAFPVFNSDRELENEEGLRFLIENCPSIDLSIPQGQAALVHFETILACPEWVFNATRQPNWNISSSDIGTARDRRLGAVIERLKRLCPEMRRLEVLLGTVQTETDLRPFVHLDYLRIHAQVVSAPIMFPENLRTLELVIESPVQQPHLLQALKSITNLTQLKNLKVRVVCPLSISTYFDAIISSLPNLQEIEFLTPTSDGQSPAVYTISHPSLRVISHTFLGTARCQAGKLPSLTTPDAALGPFDPAAHSHIQSLTCDFSKSTNDETEIELHKIMQFANLRSFHVQSLRPSGISQLGGFGNLQTLTISKCNFDEQASGRRFLMNMPWLTRLSLFEVSVHHFEFLQHPFLQELQLRVSLPAQIQNDSPTATLSPATLPMLRSVHLSVVRGKLDSFNAEGLEHLTELQLTLGGRRLIPGLRSRVCLESCDRLQSATIFSAVLDRLQIDACESLAQLKFLNCDLNAALQDSAFKIVVPRSCDVIGLTHPVNITYL